MLSTFCRRDQNIHEHYTNNLCKSYKKHAKKKTNGKKIITPNDKYDLDIPEVPSNTESTTPSVYIDNDNEINKLKEEILSLQAKNTALQEKYNKDTSNLECLLFRIK